MTSRTARRLIGALAVPAFGLGMAACTSDEPADETTGGDNGGVAQLSPEAAVKASFEGLDGDSYRMDSVMTINGLDFMVMTSAVEGDSAQSSQDIYMSAILEASGEDLGSDPAVAEMMEALFADMHTETVVVGDTAYLQITGGMYDAAGETYGEDAWFTLDLAGEGDIAGMYQQFGGMDLASQTELMLSELTDVEETGDGVYTGTLKGDSAALQTFSDAAVGTGADAIGEIAVTVALDDDGLLKSLAMTLPETDGMTIDMNSEVVEVGGSYGITAPDSTNLHPFEDLIAAMQQ
ncbi:hypothetical protein [Glycomyces sp. NRRL B-16210]|uniref:hypothetical protein n=1 Tax=Glycomyces sp. NRRL B-16210 TaxID=1463821 RepID=UPI0004BFF437|nr:hypothetical protein [Glycomyces sp. NRRL B-16210]